MKMLLLFSKIPASFIQNSSKKNDPDEPSSRLIIPASNGCVLLTPPTAAIKYHVRTGDGGCRIEE
jgi:hypothetical protein